MDPDLLGLALGAGLVAALNPCGFAILPAYLTLVVHGEGERRAGPTPVARALAATAAMSVGFVAVFGVFTLLTVSAAATVQRFLPIATTVIGIALIAVGAALLLGHHLSAPITMPQGRWWTPSARLGSMFGFGVGYAVASLSCTIGPFLAITGGVSGGGGSAVARGVSALAAYTAGFALIVGALAVGTAVAGAVVADRLRAVVPYAQRIGGALLVVVGLYVAYYGLYEIRLFMADGDPRDPVIAVAGRIQGAIAGWVHENPVIAVAVPAVLALCAVGWRTVTRRQRPGIGGRAGR